MSVVQGGKNLLSLAQISRPEPNNFYFFGAAFFAAGFFAALAVVDNFLLTSAAATSATRPKAGSFLLTQRSAVGMTDAQRALATRSHSPVEKSIGDATPEVCITIITAPIT